MYKIHRGLKIVGIIACVILFFIVICNLVLIIKSFANKDKVPSIFSVSPVYVMSGSMEPTINKGDLVFIKKVSPKKIAEQDIIAFFDPVSEEKIVIVHRVKEILVDDEEEISFMTAGDFTGVVDDIAVPSYNLVGTYVFRIRGMGYVAMFLQSTPGLVLSILIPVFLLVALEAIRIVHGKEDKEKTIDKAEKSVLAVVVPEIVNNETQNITEEMDKKSKNS